MTQKQFYIVSIKHTSKGDTALTFWGSNGGGYTYHKGRAGIYSEDAVVKYTSDDNVAVPKEAVDEFWMNADDFGDKYISVPNNSTTLVSLGLSDKLMKPKKFANCRMKFVSRYEPETT